MRESRAILQDLAATGLNPAQQALLMELTACVAAEARPVVDQAAENKRAYDRAYQAERRKNRATSYDSYDANDAALPPDKKPPDPKKLTPDPCVRESRARGYHRLPSGWQPTRPHPVPLQAKLDQWPPGAVADEIASFKRWAANAKDENGKGRKLDWDKALWNWLGRRHDEHYGRSRNGMGRHQPADGLSPTTRAANRVWPDAPFGARDERAVSQ